jgi:hypothetical protein
MGLEATHAGSAANPVAVRGSRVFASISRVPVADRRPRLRTHALGRAGDLVVELRHLNEPAQEIGPIQTVHDHNQGRTIGQDTIDLHELLQRRATLWHLGGVPVAEAAGWLGHGPQEHLQTYAHGGSRPATLTTGS